MDVTTLILNFQEFLNAGYANWHKSARTALTNDNGFLDESLQDWAQANWELLVERPLCEPGQYLEIYSSGSDYEMQLHARVFFHEARPTHEIRCELVAGASNVDLLTTREIEPLECSFDRFVATDGTWFSDQPPFDKVLLVNGECQHMLPVSSVRFLLQERRHAV